MCRLRPGDRFRDSRGCDHQVIALAKDPESGEQMLVYQGLFGDFETFVRPLSKVEVEIGEKAAPAEPELPEQTEKEPEAAAASKPDFAKDAPELMMDFFDTDNFDEKYRILKAMRSCKDMTDTILDNMAATLDVVIDDGDMEYRLSQLIRCVDTRRRFEVTRLR